ncbi:hypothetical protein ACUXST_001244 [Sphingomonas sp. F9_3S_D5_B_2]|jgi:hypothetical protein
MKRILAALSIVAVAPLLGGCVAGMAASALSMAARSAQGTPVSNEALQPQAREACTAQAAPYGTVQIIDVQQQKTDRIVVWGTTDDGKQRQSFECRFGTKITGFTIRPITQLR